MLSPSGAAQNVLDQAPNFAISTWFLSSVAAAFVQGSIDWPFSESRLQALLKLKANFDIPRSLLDGVVERQLIVDDGSCKSRLKHQEASERGPPHSKRI